MKKKIGILLLLLSFFGLTTQSVLAYKNPGMPTGFLNDYGKMLSAQDKSEIESKLVNYQKSTGNEIAVVTVSDLGGDTVENFAVQLFQDWGIGVKGKDNGALLLISRDDHEMRIEVGYGLEPVLTDAQASSIIRNILTPAFKQNDFAGGINDALDSMIAAIGGDVNAIPSNPSVENVSPTIVGFIVFVLIWVAAILGRSKSWWLGGVIGGIAGVVLTFIFGFWYIGLAGIVLLIPIGLLFDFVVSKIFSNSLDAGMRPPWWIGGGGFGGGAGGGFGGFGGGGSGGGGASGRW